MAHITLGNDLPGIVGLLNFRPQTGRPLSELAEVLLRGDNSLSRGERELIAAYVSAENDCRFCYSSHAASAEAQLPEGTAPVEEICADPAAAHISGKMKALLDIAGAVRQSGKAVTEQHVAAARAAGASDVEIHDVVLIAAAFCMYNRYVDGLAAFTPDDPARYKAMAALVVEAGYVRGDA
ncbi:carboxymuconolactone decarboxylase [Planotetraspora thailandica]|uniref:Carboxymuconolactone decarboxylase n=1 Tax=Planotetraspora thailandica TaxID=487172 RepID=A0A8J3XX69_9ACTN|nr:peroxidase-related enzyme [Planotetraspora thailandica]GII52563.1 carboxymuconolactone decarboxylase [Planotetraspora thailandica]